MCFKPSTDVALIALIAKSGNVGGIFVRSLYSWPPFSLRSNNGVLSRQLLSGKQTAAA
jgi:hypothetical protein